jgi:DNA-binding MarR family transcriptional regulator
MDSDFGYDMDHGLGYRLGLVATRIKISLRRVFMAAGFDVTPEQWVVLFRLHQRQGQSQSELGDRSVKDKTTITRILDRLEHKGLAQRRRDPLDRRSQRIFLTPGGEAALAALMPLVHRFAADTFEDIEPAERDTVLRVLDGIEAKLDRFHEPKDTP